MAKDKLLEELARASNALDRAVCIAQFQRREITALDLKTIHKQVRDILLRIENK